MSDEAVKWLRGQVTARLETAKAACHGGDGNWWRRLRDLYIDGGPVPAGALFEGTPEVDAPEHDIFIAEVVVYDEGRPSDEQFAHIALNDPQDVIARCEAELAILDEFTSRHRDVDLMLGPTIARQREWEGLRLAVHLLASGYKHRDGYAEHWGKLTQQLPQPRSK